MDNSLPRVLAGRLAASGLRVAPSSFAWLGVGPTCAPRERGAFLPAVGGGGGPPCARGDRGVFLRGVGGGGEPRTERAEVHDPPRRRQEDQLGAPEGCATGQITRRGGRKIKCDAHCLVGVPLCVARYRPPATRKTAPVV